MTIFLTQASVFVMILGIALYFSNVYIGNSVDFLYLSLCLEFLLSLIFHQIISHISIKVLLVSCIPFNPSFISKMRLLFSTNLISYHLIIVFFSNSLLVFQKLEYVTDVRCAFVYVLLLLVTEKSYLGQ